MPHHMSLETQDVTLVCACGRRFTPKRRNQRLCSRKCVEAQFKLRREAARISLLLRVTAELDRVEDRELRKLLIDLQLYLS
jgi:hypothetical protein